MFLNAMKIKDLSQAPLAESISYNGPLCGEPIRGRDLVTRFLSVFLPVLKDVRVIRHIADGDYVATIWQADTSFGEVSLVYVLRLEAGKIAEIQAFYDPRGFLERLGT
ncbi:MAG TPA: nuclear transport factor 2 family protein [Bryobacteraceae bacterium]|nr:nuclear transport factor 2 family protein [Bryobacteraceae bacterium]